MISRHHDFRGLGASLAVLALAGFAAEAAGAPIAGVTYMYDLTRSDPNTMIFTTPHADADDTITLSVLTDGDLGSLEPVTGGGGSAVFPNGTYAGFRNDGFGGASQPGIVIDLHGTYALNSFTLHYLVEDPSSIYSPQPIPDGSGGFVFEGLTVYDYTGDEQSTLLGGTSEFTPVFGLDGDFGSGLTEVRTATIDLAGASAAKLFVDVHTPYSFIFLSEFVVDGAGSGPNPDFDGDSDVDGNDVLIWQRGLGVSTGATRSQGDADGDGAVDAADLSFWRMSFGTGGAVSAAQAAPEPASLWLATLGCGGARTLARARCRQRQ